MPRLALILAETLPLPALAQQQRPTPVGKFDTAKERALDPPADQPAAEAAATGVTRKRRQ